MMVARVSGVSMYMLGCTVINGESVSNSNSTHTMYHSTAVSMLTGDEVHMIAYKNPANRAAQW